MRKHWQHYTSPIIKTKLNKAIKDLKKLLSEEKNARLQMYLHNLSPSETAILYGKLLKKLKQSQQTSSPIMKQDGYWTRIEEKTEIFAEIFAHLIRVFISNTREIEKS
jgi:hypothetical protein